MLTRHIRESLQVTPGPFPDFWVGPGDEAIILAHSPCTVPENTSSLHHLLTKILVTFNRAKKKKKKKEKIHSLALALTLTLTVTLSPNHPATR